MRAVVLMDISATKQGIPLDYRIVPLDQWKKKASVSTSLILIAP